jgi:dienelactone hydrolase
MKSATLSVVAPAVAAPAGRSTFTTRAPRRRLLVHTFEGAGHGFMGNQAGAGGANLKAAQDSWPLAVQFFAKNLK